MNIDHTDPDRVITAAQAEAALTPAQREDRDAALTVSVNWETIRRRAATALTANAAFLALASPTNAQVLAQTKALTRECSALIRLALNQLDSITDT